MEGCCIGFTKFCVTLLSSSDAEIRDIPADMLEEVSEEVTSMDFLSTSSDVGLLVYSWRSVSPQGLKVVQSPRLTSVTRRAAGLPMLILCVCSAGETSKTRSLLRQSMRALLETAETPLPDNWDQTLDLPQVAPHGRSRVKI